MTAAEVLDRLKALGIQVLVRDGKLVTRQPPGIAIPPDLAGAIRSHRDELVQLLLEASGPAPEARCAGCGAGLEPEEVPTGVCEGCAQAPALAGEVGPPAARLLALAESQGYPEMEAGPDCPGPVRRIPAGPVSWTVSVRTMTPSERRYWLGRLEEARGAAAGHPRHLSTQ